MLAHVERIPAVPGGRLDSARIDTLEVDGGSCCVAALLVWLVRCIHVAGARLRLEAVPAQRCADLHWRWLLLLAGPDRRHLLRARAALGRVPEAPQARIPMRNLFSATVIGFTAITLFGRPGSSSGPI